MTTTQESQLGMLRSEIKFTLHTQYAHKLWIGRNSTKDEKGKITQSSILSMPNALKLIGQIQQDAAQDDPYADDYLLRFEEKVLTYRQEMQQLVTKLVNIYADRLPESIEFERCSNVSPISYPIYVNSQLGYQLLYLLGDFDNLARVTMTAAHIALLTRADAQEWLEAGAVLLRKCFGVVENYKHSGVTRKYAQEYNARYQAAIKRMWYEVPDYILSGERRADYAPFIRNNSLLGDENEQPVESQVTANTENE